jgi:hypothetical protein
MTLRVVVGDDALEKHSAERQPPRKMREHEFATECVIEGLYSSFD